MASSGHGGDPLSDDVVGTIPSAKSAPPRDIGHDATIESVALGQEGPDDLRTVDPSHYEHHEELARGGMGVVRRVYDLRVGREVALKELIRDKPHWRRRFQREARVTGQLQHPGIVPVYEVGRWPNGRPFFAMKLVQGRPLQEVIDEALDLRARLALVSRLLPAVEAMAYAHDQGVIHRDLKPSNILLGEFGETVVIDWGLARAIGEDDDEPSAPGQTFSSAPPSSFPPPSSSNGISAARSGGQLTLAGSVVGTPAYMPPEQACGDPVDARADVYALGALLYHTLTGRRPYEGETAKAILGALLRGPTPPIRELAPELPGDLAGIVEKAMAQDPLGRYADAGELAQDLRAFTNGRLVGAHNYTSWELVVRFVRRNRSLSAALVALMMVATISSVVTYRAYRVSEGQRLRAEQAETRALREEAAVHERLAQMHVNGALERLRDQDHLGAELLAAASLLEHPGNPSGPYHGLLGPKPAGGQPPRGQTAVAAPGAIWAAARALRFAVRGRELPTHGDWVYDVLPSRQGDWAVTAGADRKVHVWHTRTGKLHATLEGHGDTVFQLALSPDERHLATSGYDGTVRLWSFPDGAPVRTLQHPTDRVYGLCFSSENQLVAAGAGGVLAFFDAVSGALVDQMEGLTGLPWRLSCGRNTPLALLGSKDDGALVIDLSAREVKHRLEDGSAAVRDALITPDEKFAITSDRSGRLRRYDLGSGALVHEGSVGAPIATLAISASGRWLAAGGTTITVVDSASFRTVARLRGHRSVVGALAFDAMDQHLFSGGRDHRVLEWVIPQEPAARRFMLAEESRIDAIALSRDRSSVFVAGENGRVTGWDRRRGQLRQSLEVHAGPIRALRILDDSHLVTAGVDRTLKVIDIRRPEVTRTIELPHFGDELSLHPDGRTLALGLGDGAVAFYDTRTWKMRHTREVHEGRAWWVGYDPSGRRLATAGFSGSIAILDAKDGRALRRWRGHPARIYHAAWRHDGGELITIDTEGWVRGWDPSTGSATRAFRVLGGERLTSVDYAADDTQLLITSRNGLRIYDPAGQLLARLDLGAATKAQWTDDGRVAVAIHGEVIILRLDPSTWRGDPRPHVEAAEEASSGNLQDLRDMAR